MDRLASLALGSAGKYETGRGLRNPGCHSRPRTVLIKVQACRSQEHRITFEGCKQDLK